MKLGSIVGVSIKVNYLFLVLLIVYTILGLGWEILLIVLAVLIHEMAHTLVAIGSGIKVTEIELWPFGGQARVEGFLALEPGKEFYIAAAGPVTSLLLAAFFYFLPVNPNTYQQLFVVVNLLLGIFNLLPALPLDGGRILRAAISPLIGFKKATAHAAILGKTIAIALFITGLYFININLSALNLTSLNLTSLNLSDLNLSALNLIIVAIMLYLAARREDKLLSYAFMRYLVNKKGQLAQKGMMPARHFVSRPDTEVKALLAFSKPSFYMLVIIIDADYGAENMLGEAELIEGLLEKGPRVRLRDFQVHI